MARWQGAEPRTAVVTGAASGIGAATAERLAAEGWQLALLDIDLAAAEAVATRCGSSAAAFETDITSQKSVDAAVAAAVARFGGIDLCFANAGIATEGSLRFTDPEVFAVQVDVNLTGTFRTVKACLPHVLDSRGYILINASASSIAAPPGLGAYGSSKAGVEGLGDVLRRELRHLGVDVGVVYLLFVGTDMVEGAESHGRMFGTIRSSFTGPLSNVIPVERAVYAIVRGIAKRSRRIVAPRIVGALFRLRGVAPAILERDMMRMAAAVEEATLADQASRDAPAAGMRTDTAANAAAAAAVDRRSD